MDNPALPQGRSDPPPGSQPTPADRPDGPEGSSLLDNVGPALGDTTSEPQPADSGAAIDLFFNPHAEPSDDAPTIISKARPAPDDAAAGGLRGRRLAHYELLEAIGVGGMAAVLRARDTQLDRTVALKILPPEMAADPENVRRFNQEARSAAKLDHENIARVFFCGEDQKLHFIAFEYVEGENLRTLIERRGWLPAAEALHYMLQVATGLAHAAARGVVHRDIKPSNIIISPGGRAKLVDMGLARLTDTHTDHGLTQSGVTLGTFDYISPEQALEPREADVRSDIYSLGCTFYHALTGHAPVPEGTAAKKLHHHQHVAPLDPRQLNPDVPDEVAAILARMMAKEPNDRYQRAEHLVQHLIQAAQKLGTLAPGADAAEGMLFVDAPLPAPPRTRPLLVSGIGALLLVFLIVVFGRGPGPWQGGKPTILSGLPGSGKDDGAAAKEAGAGQPVKDGGAEPAPPKDVVRPAAAGRDVARFEPKSVRELAEWLRQNTRAEQIDLVLGTDLTLPDVPTDGEPIQSLVVRARRVTIRAQSGKHPTIRVVNNLQPKTPERLALVIESDDVTLKGLRFEIDAKLGSPEMAGVVLRGGPGAQYKLSGCEFVQLGQVLPPPQTVRTASILLEPPRPESDRPTLDLRDCAFLAAEERGRDGGLRNVAQSGHDAVALRSAADVRIASCAFGPHHALVRLEGSDGSLAVDHCAALLAGEAAAFHLAGRGDGPGWRLEVRHSVFSGRNLSAPWFAPPDFPPEADYKGAVLLRQDGAAVPVRFEGEDNRYQNLDAFWVRPAATRRVAAERLRDFRDELKKGDGHDSGPELADGVRLWKEPDPLKALERDDAQKAFVVADRLRGSDRALVGLRRYLDVPMPDANLSPADGPDPAPAAARNQKIVDPSAETGSGVYSSLAQALEEAKDGDVILLRFTGPQATKPLRLEKPIEVTIQPHPGSRPVVTLGASTEPNAFLFRLHDGKLHLQDVEFRLRSGKEKSQTVAEIVGDGECTFKHCTLTLEDAGGGALAAVTLADPSQFMKMEVPGGPPRPAAGRPHVRFDGCLVRGDGDLVVVRADRPFDLEAEHTLAALAGSFLSVEGAREDAMAPAGQLVQLTLKSVTTYLGGHLVRLRADKDFRGEVPVQVDASDCLFVSVTGNKALIHLDGPDPGDRLKELLAWKPGGRNAYVNFRQYLLDQQQRGDDTPGLLWGPKEWKQLAGEEPKFSDSRLKIPTWPLQASPLARVLPGQFRVKPDADLAGYGANLDQLPQPAAEPAPRPERK